MTTTSTTAPLPKEEGEAAEPAQEAKDETKANAEARETTHIAEDSPCPAEAEAAEADQLEEQNNETCDGYRRKENRKLQ